MKGTSHELADRLTALTRDLMLIRSTERLPEERARCFRFIENHLEAVGNLRLRTYDCQGDTSLVALPENVERPTILLNGHIDVVEHPGLDVYRGKVEHGRIVGPGAGDMKGAVAILLELFREIQRLQPGASVGLALTSDEERGGENGMRHLFEDAGLRCGLAIIPDGGSLHDLTVAEKGILHLRVKRHGHPGHAARPWLADNALQGLIDALNRLHDRFRGLVPPDAEDHWHPTATVTHLRTPNEAVNRIPGFAEACLDIRFPPPFRAAAILELVSGALGPSVEVETIVSAEPTELSPDPLFAEVTEEITGHPVRRVRASGGSDARFLCAHGIPVMLSRPLVGNLHAEDEWIDIASMVRYYEICETYLIRKLGLAVP
jgi:succinyl-diaminopimelate desuccinylase